MDVNRSSFPKGMTWDFEKVGPNSEALLWINWKSNGQYDYSVPVLTNQPTDDFINKVKYLIACYKEKEQQRDDRAERNKH